MVVKKSVRNRVFKIAVPKLLSFHAGGLLKNLSAKCEDYFGITLIVWI